MKPYFLIVLCLSISSVQAVQGSFIRALVEDSSEKHTLFHVKILDSEIDEIESGKKYNFRVGLGDQSDQYVGREIQSDAFYY